MPADVRVAGCSFEAAEYAVKRWHYSRSMPAAKTTKFGVWEAGRFIGAVIFSRGATASLGRRYGLEQTECAELTRVALREHVAPTSQIVAAALRELRRTSPGLRLVVSFADPNEGHHGGIYQAGNWVYTGSIETRAYFLVHGRLMHPRSVAANRWRQSLGWLRRHVDPNATEVEKPGKHRYVMPLDKAMRRRIVRLAKPYPHAVEASTVTRGGSTAESRVRLPATAPLTRTGGRTHGKARTRTATNRAQAASRREPPGASQPGRAGSAAG